ncbi:MAG: AEC family transporter [Methylophilaceae bacterium]
MLSVMLQMAVLIALGIGWQYIAPKHIPVLSHRRALTDLVFYILLPALVLDVMWQAPLNIDSIKISATALSSIFVSLLLMWIILRFLNVSKAQKGALLIAATFPNSTYLGLPVTAQALGDWSQAIVLKYDLFACTPLVLTLGVLIAHHFGDHTEEIHPFRALLKVPPLWALGFAVLLNVMNIPQPAAAHNALDILAGGVVPLMLIALGMSIRWESLKLSYLPLLLPVCLIALVIAPMVAYTTATALNIPTETLTVAVILAAMPTMIFGIVLCERFKLDSSLYAAAVFLTTLLSIGSLTVWFNQISDRL